MVVLPTVITGVFGWNFLLTQFIGDSDIDDLVNCPWKSFDVES